MAKNLMGNSFGSSTESYNSGKNVWHEVKGQYPVGGIVDIASIAAGTVIPAGSMLAFNQSNKTVKVIKASDTAGLDTVNGLLYNDILVDAAAKANGCVTATVIFAGEIYADRLAETIPATVWAKLPMIVAIHEA